jgi:hypothetical protein
MRDVLGVGCYGRQPRPSSGCSPGSNFCFGTVDEPKDYVALKALGEVAI